LILDGDEKKIQTIETELKVFIDKEKELIRTANAKFDPVLFK